MFVKSYICDICICSLLKCLKVDWNYKMMLDLFNGCGVLFFVLICIVKKVI